MMTISQDLRIRLVQKVARGMSCRRAAAYFEVRPSSAIRFTRQYETEGTVPLKVRGAHKRRLNPYGEDLLSWIEEAPDMTLQELSERLSCAHAIRAPKSTIDDWFRSRRISFKNTAHASEQERPDVQAEPMPSSSSIRPGGTSQKPWRYRTTSPCCPCRRIRRNSTRSKTSGSSCAITGSPTRYSNPTTILSCTVASPGTNSSINLGKLCQSDYVSGRINDSFCNWV